MTRKDPDGTIADFLGTQFELLFDAVPGLYGVLFVTADGDPVSARLQDGMDRERLSAMSSSLVALGETMAKTAHQEDCEYAIVQNKDGYIVSLRIGKHLLLTALARKDTNLGMLLSSCRSTARNVSDRITRKSGSDTGEEIK